MSGFDYPPFTDPTTEARDGIITRHVAGIGMIILLYDLIITIPKEVHGHKYLF
jgi:hypothetical protein